MPCNSDYLEPTPRESYNQLTAQCLQYVLLTLGHHARVNLMADAENSYCSVDHTAELCSICFRMSPEQLNTIVYDGRNPKARKLADWLEAHQANDARREADETRKAQRQAALDKLTPDERKLLGL